MAPRAGPTARPTPALPPPPTPTPAFPPAPPATTASRRSTPTAPAPLPAPPNATTDDAAPTVPGAPDRPHGNGQREQPDRPLLDRAGRRWRLRHHRLQDRGFAQWQLELDRPRRQHQQHQHHLRAHRPRRRHHPLLPRLGHQLGRHRRRLQHRQRHHRRRRPHRARRPDRPHGNGQRDQHDQPHLERAVQRRRRLDQRLQDRGFAQWQLELDQPRGQHRQHQPAATPTPASTPAPPATTASRRSTRSAPAPPPVSANATTDDDDEPGLAVVTVHALATSVSVEGLARFELRRSGGDPGLAQGQLPARRVVPTATTWSRGATSSRASRGKGRTTTSGGRPAR